MISYGWDELLEDFSFASNYHMRGNTANGNGNDGFRLNASSYTFDGNFATGPANGVWVRGDSAIVENNASRTRSSIGRVPFPGGASIRRPRCFPAMIRTAPG